MHNETPNSVWSHIEFMKRISKALGSPAIFSKCFGSLNALNMISRGTLKIRVLTISRSEIGSGELIIFDIPEDTLNS